MQNIEETLSQELREVAAGLHVPAMPALEQPSRAQRHWLPMLAAAAVLLIVLGVVAALSIERGGETPDPAPPSPTPTPSETKTSEPPVEVPTGAPTIPYVLDDTLYVDGEPVPGTWWYLSVGGPTWLALRADENWWWWGRGPELTNEITDASADFAPVLSPNGSFLAVVRRYGLVSLIDTRDGREVGSLPVDFGEPEFRIRAVTNDGKVIVHGTETATLWLPLVDDTTVDLTETAPGQVFLESTPAGLVVSDGFDGEQYLAEISDAGELEPLGDLPPNDSLVVSTVAEYMVWTPPGTLGGEVTAIGSLESGNVAGGQRATLTLPDGWAFKVQDWAWETDDRLVSTVVKGAAERMARCSVLTQSCVLIDAP